MSTAQKLFRAGLVGVRGFSTAPRLGNKTPSNVVDTTKLKAQQARFQVENDLPVHLKGGAADVFLYRLTWTLCILGLGGFVHLIYSLDKGASAQSD